MAYFTFEGKEIYYEIHGSGKPLVMLNGIMMSCMSWGYFTKELSKNNQLIMVDFLDQGKSSKMEEEYTIDIQAEVIHGLLSHLSIAKADIMGISYGGEVAQIFAIKYKEMVDRLMLFNTTSQTGHWLRNIGDGWNKATSDPESYYLTTIPIIYSPEFYKKNINWMNNRKELLMKVFADKSFTSSMIRLTNSSANFDVTDRLREITAETLVVSGQQDYLTPIEDQAVIANAIPNASHVIIPNCGHGSMYEKPVLFTSLILGFIGNTTNDFKII